MEASPSLLLLDDPTRGVDVGAKLEIRGLIRRLASQQRVVLFNSSEISDYERVCDRVLVIREGRVVQEFVDGEIGESALLEAIHAKSFMTSQQLPRPIPTSEMKLGS